MPSWKYTIGVSPGRDAGLFGLTCKPFGINTRLSVENKATFINGQRSAASPAQLLRDVASEIGGGVFKDSKLHFRDFAGEDASKDVADRDVAVNAAIAQPLVDDSLRFCKATLTTRISFDDRSAVSAVVDLVWPILEEEGRTAFPDRRHVENVVRLGDSTLAIWNQNGIAVVSSEQADEVAKSTDNTIDVQLKSLARILRKLREGSDDMNEAGLLEALKSLASLKVKVLNSHLEPLRQLMAARGVDEIVAAQQAQLTASGTMQERKIQSTLATVGIALAYLQVFHPDWQKPPASLNFAAPWGWLGGLFFAVPWGWLGGLFVVCAIPWIRWIPTWCLSLSSKAKALSRRLGL